MSTNITELTLISSAQGPMAVRGVQIPTENGGDEGSKTYSYYPPERILYE